MSDQGSSRSAAAEPVIAAPLMRSSLAAYSKRPDRRQARCCGVNISICDFLLRGVVKSIATSQVSAAVPNHVKTWNGNVWFPQYFRRVYTSACPLTNCGTVSVDGN